MGELRVAGGRSVEVSSDRDRVLEALRDALAAVESGEIEANRCIVLLASNQVEDLVIRDTYHGRTLEMLGWLEVLRRSYLKDMGLD